MSWRDREILYLEVSDLHDFNQWLLYYILDWKFKNPDFFHLQVPKRRRQPQPGGPLQASWSSKSTWHIMHVLCLIIHKDPLRWVPDMSDPLEHLHRRRQTQPGGPLQANWSSKST